MFSHVAGVSFFSCLEEKRCYDLSATFKAEGVFTMHLIKDENGNLIQHGHEHTHQHTHADGVSHTHAHTHDGSEGHDHTHNEGQNCSTDCGGCQGGDCKNETVALLTYMLQHNEHHAAELDQMADNLARWVWMPLRRPLRKAYLISRKATCALDLALDSCKRGK